MFFSSVDLLCNIISVLKLDWGARNLHSGLRSFSALSFRIKGDVRFIHGNNTITTVKSGQVTFVPANYPYTQQNSNDESVVVIHFNSSFPLCDTIKKFTPKDSGYFERKFIQIYNIWQKKQLAYEFECQSVFYKILTKIEQEYRPQTIYTDIEKIDEALEYIHENYLSSDIKVEQLAKMCAMSDVYFRRLFYKQFAKTPLKYINDLKIKFAIEALNSGYYNVKEVSDMCNFENVYYFSNFIKKHTGLSPRNHIPKNHP